MRGSTKPLKIFVVLLSTVWFCGRELQVLRASPAGTVPCTQFMAPQKNVNGKMVGQEECLMQDHGAVDPDQKYHRVDMGITGTLSGWITKEGARSNHFTSAPDFYFTQYGNDRPRFHGILRYEAAKGTSLTLTYPETVWNGKLYVMVHGSGGSFLRGTMKPWDQYWDPAKPLDVTRFEKAMLEKGYAVARTRRNAERDAPGDYDVVLDNGEVWPSQNVAEVPELIMHDAILVKNFLKERLGRRPARTYWYGKSGGAMMSTLVNYMSQLNPELNKDTDGKPTFDGMLWDDVGGGMFLPFLIRDGRDVLFSKAGEKSGFIKSLEIAHLAYPNVFSNETPWMMETDKIPEKISPVFLANKRTRARMLHNKGLDGVYRIYEVRGISHNSGDTMPESGQNGDVAVLQLTRMMDALIDLLDNWVEKGIEPPASKSDVDLGTGNKMNAVSLPEVSCPVGVYHPYPPSQGSGGVGSTGLALFTGQGIEPVDGRMVFVDMNGNGRRDKRETMTEAWRRLGMLKAGETFSQAKYVECVRGAVGRLRKENLLTAKGAEQYLSEAQTKQFPSM
ncbi:MAG: hypothetical protein HYX74_03685 [Acidobacteria bacterium]|nr:hypothetical protein [Acidobacteriota bacterium]